MKRRKLTESYGRRFTPWTNFIGVLLIVVFGIFLALNESHKEKTGEQTPTEQVTE